MIEEFEENNNDYFSLAGRTTLVGGSAYAMYKTGSDMYGNRPVNPNNQSFRNQVGRISKITPSAFDQTQIPTVGPYKDILGDTREFRERSKIKFQRGIPESLTSAGFRQPGALAQEISGFKSSLLEQGFTGVEIYHKSQNDAVGQVRIKGRYGGRMFSFDVNPITSEGSMFLGDNLQNKFSARGVLDRSSIADRVSQSNLNVLDPDVALVRRYRSSIDDIKKGALDPRKLYRQIQDVSIFEESNMGAAKLTSPTGVLRRDQVAIDPFKELSKQGKEQLMRELTQIPGYTGGGPGQFSKGILTAPGSILSQIPGGDIAPSTYQLIRESSFDESVRPSLRVFDDKAGIGEFKYAHASDKGALERAVRHVNPDIGEIADEEMIMNRNRNFMVQNRLYNAKINLDQEATQSGMNLIEKVTNRLGLSSTQELGEVLSKPGGLASMGEDAIQKINFDISEDYKKLRTKEDVLKTQLDTLDKFKAYDPKTRTSKRGEILDELKGVREQMREFDILGVSEDMSSTSKLPAKDLQNRIVNMTVDSNNNVSVALESHYRFGVGSKSFGAAKSTVKAEMDTAEILAQMEFEKVQGRFGSRAELERYGLLDEFADVDFIGVESPVKTIKGRGLEARRLPSAVTTYLSTAISEGREEELMKLGVTKQGDRYIPPQEDARETIRKIQDMHPDKNLDEIFSGTRRGAAGVNISSAILSADIHSLQSGMGNKGSVTERSLYYLESLGLGDVTDDIYSRAIRPTDTFSQVKHFETASQAMGKKGTPDIPTKSLLGSGHLDPSSNISPIFSQNLDERAEAIRGLTGGDETLYVDLGQRTEDVTGIRRVPVFSQRDMAPYVGTQIGADESITALDRTTQDLINASLDSKQGNEDRLMSLAQEYKKEMDTTKESLTKAITKAKVKGSIYGQAVSSIGGLDQAGTDLARRMGLQEDVTAPIIAMTKEDIRSKFGKDALNRATRGDLFGLVSREPIEGVHSVVPSQIAVAEDMMGGSIPKELGDMEGRIFVSGSEKSKSLLRNALMVDFDKDALNVIAAQSEKANQQIKKFMGLDPAGPTNAGQEYFESLMRMRTFDPKGKEPVDALKVADEQLAKLLGAQKTLEKGSIGIFSNEFKNVHIGLREQMAQAGDRVSSRQFFLGEDFSHLFVENIIKSKHQSEAALMKNEAMETLDILNARNKYKAASTEERAARLQGIFDQLLYNKADTGTKARQVAQSTDIMESLRADRGLAMELGVAEEVDNQLRFTESREFVERKVKAFAEVSSEDNIRNILKAHSTGRRVAKQGDYAYESIKAAASSPSKFQTFADDAVNYAKTFYNKGLKNVGKYALAPTAAIGFASSIISKPNIMNKTTESSKKHEETRPEISKVSHPKTIFAIPESKVDNVRIKGVGNANTDIDQLSGYAKQRDGATHVSYNDLRSKPDKHRLQELIDKGY